MPPVRHARLSASSSERWMHCTGSVRLSAGLPQYDTKYKLEGRAAHALAEVCLRNGGGSTDFWRQDAIEITQDDGTMISWPVDEEMRQHVDLFLRTVRSFQTSPSMVLHIEQKLSLARLQPPEEMFGTGDVALVDVAQGYLHVFDLKYGAGVVVHVLDNPQLKYYVVGSLLMELTRGGFEVQTLEAALRVFPHVVVTIVQPRAYHVDGPVRTIELTREEILSFAEELLAKARETQDPNAPLTPGTWCRFCPAAGHCPALAKHNQLVAVDDFTDVPLPPAPPDPEHLTLPEVAELYAKGNLLREWLRALEVRIERALAHGEEVPGWKLVEKRAVRRWAEPGVETAHALSEMGFASEDYMAPAELRSPAQLEKLVGRKRLPDALFTKASLGYKLVPESDARPALRLSPADDFPALPPGTEADERLEE